jgi:hypothetical protein
MYLIKNLSVFLFTFLDKKNTPGLVGEKHPSVK